MMTIQVLHLVALIPALAVVAATVWAVVVTWGDGRWTPGWKVFWTLALVAVPGVALIAWALSRRALPSAS